MAGDAALKGMTVAAFLDWDDGTDTRFELYQGHPLAMAPSTGAHGTLQSRLAGAIDRTLSSRPSCRPISEAGIARHLDAMDYFVADIAATCAPDRRGSRITEAPFLIVVVLSDSTERIVRTVKLPFYRSLDSVREIVLLDSRRPFAEVHRRIPGDIWAHDLVVGADGLLRLESAPLEVRLSELWRGLAMEEEGDPDQGRQ